MKKDLKLKKKKQKEFGHKVLEFLDNNKQKVSNSCINNSRNLSSSIKYFLMLKMKLIINKYDYLL